MQIVTDLKKAKLPGNYYMERDNSYVIIISGDKMELLVKERMEVHPFTVLPEITNLANFDFLALSPEDIVLEYKDEEDLREYMNKRKLVDKLCQ